MAWDSSTYWDNKDSLINIKKDTEDSGLELFEDEKYKKFIEKTYQIIESVEEIGLPRENEQIRLVTFKSFNAALFLAHICEKEKIKHLLLVVYSINAEAAQLICSLIDSGKIEKCTILMSNLRNKAHRKKEQVTRDMFVDNAKVDLFFASAHSKIMCMETEKDNFYCLEGSGNLSFNSRVEQYVIDNDKKLFYFTKNWMDKIKVYLAGKKELVLT
jgi:hypothetical protein